MLAEIFAKNVKKHRKIKGYSQEKLAELSGLHRTYIAGIETVSRNVSLKNIEKISVALGIEPIILLDLDTTNGK